MNTQSLRYLIENELQTRLAPDYLVVLDESAAHAGHSGHREGGESHFRIRIVSADFSGRSRLQRHRMINEMLEIAFARGVHALAIEARAPGEPTGWGS